MLGKLSGLLIALLLLPLASTAQDDDAGFTSIFTSQDLTGWHEMGQQDWHAENGILWTEGKGGWLRSDSQYADFLLRLDYRVTKGAVSGIFLRSAEQGDPAFT